MRTDPNEAETFNDITPDVIRLRKDAYLRILADIAPDRQGRALIEFCAVVGAKPVYLPHFRHALDHGATRADIAKTLLGGE